MPRSGTSWLSQILDSSENVAFRMAPLFSYEFKDRVNENSSEEDWNIFFKDIFLSSNSFLLQTERRQKGEFPIFEKNDLIKNLVVKDVRNHHVVNSMLGKVSSVKVVYIIRNPKATIWSWINSKKEFPEDANPIEEWKYGECRKITKGEYWGFEDWKTLSNQYLKLQALYPERVYIVRYEDLVLNTTSETEKIFEFLNLDTCKQTYDFIEESTSEHDLSEHSVFKESHIVLNGYKKGLPLVIAKEIDSELEATVLEKFNLD